jgi:hypothetical protein
MTGEAFSALLYWLVKRKWGLSFLLAIVSFFGLVFTAVERPQWQAQLDYYFIQGPVFRAGFYMGTLFRLGNATSVLFGATMDVLALIVFWRSIIFWIARFRTGKQDATLQGNT